MIGAALRRPALTVALGFLVLVTIACVGAPLWVPTDPLQQDLGAILQPPSSAHLLGTDGLGRDVLSRLASGGRVTLLGALEAVVVFLALGVPLGLLAGYHAGRFDTVTTRVAEVLLSVPAIIFLLVVVAVFPASQLATMITLGVLGTPNVFRVVRGSARAASQELYVRAAQTVGLTSGQVLRRHIAPALSGPIIVQTSLFAATAVMTDSALAFLGFSVQPPQPSWGGMIAEASAVIDADPWLLVPPGVLIALVVLALGILGDGVRDLAARSVASVERPRRRPRRAAPAAPRAPGPSAGPPALLSLHGVTVAFPAPHGEVTVVRDVALDVCEGQAVGIVGESGCGKSVVARAVLGLLPGGARLTDGSIRFDGRELAGRSERELGRVLGAHGRELARRSERELGRVRGAQIGFVPQDPIATLDPAFTVGQQLTEVVRRHRGGSRPGARARAVALLAMVDLPDPEQVVRRYPHQLSGGMAQRVGIALALAGEPKLLIADEPTTALDMTVQAEVLGLLRDLRERLGMAIVLITHDWGVLADVCDDAVVMYAGEVVEVAPVQSLFAASLHPYTRALIASNPLLARAGEPLPAIPGQVPAPGAWPAGCHFVPRCPLAVPACSGELVALGGPGGAHRTRCLRHEELAPR
ncbi:MAG TPA: dipeptide/oligopeptide/nickel ABC transporter permease/ATP-binding protein [Baekduia sp.]|uniref:dipeptide/oligopeptide/nickel ABC transporter permease/ATP-binding protein n=1 Tax=Baekduia sp. TaxID=2600305 RepID=UPI002C3A9C1E|nr:dipeptide/oligopeptide/nickel ABC transporter permease/ATP-binding protein [Baekduia sp.]HMJ36705.1 dipeptide/oligopeptide/nickel ABC transporter permease/ATP-binding protein [Baekduia sp.]